MGRYAVTGCASGTGRAVAARLRARGDEVIGIDLHDGEITADLATAHGRAEAIAGVLDRSAGHLDGAVIDTGAAAPRDLAGLPSGAAGTGHDVRSTIVGLHYSAVVDLLDAWRPAFAAVPGSRVVVCADQSSVATVAEALIRAMLSGNVSAVVEHTARFGSRGPALAYAASKTAVVRWVQREAMSAEWGGKGIRLNAVAGAPAATPGAGLEQRLRAFAGPAGDTESAADTVVAMLSAAGDTLRGAVVVAGARKASRWSSTGWDGDDAANPAEDIEVAEEAKVLARWGGAPGRVVAEPGPALRARW